MAPKVQASPRGRGAGPARGSGGGGAALGSRPPPPALAPEERALDLEQLRRGLASLALLAPQPAATPKASAKAIAAGASAATRASTPGPSRRRASTAALPASRELRPGKAQAGGRRGDTTAVDRGAEKKTLKETSSGITKPDIRRLARKAGCQRVAMTLYEEAREVLTEFLNDILENAAVFTDHAKRKTVVTDDVIQSLRRRGKTVYGQQ